MREEDENEDVFIYRETRDCVCVLCVCRGSNALLN